MQTKLRGATANTDVGTIQATVIDATANSDAGTIQATLIDATANSDAGAIQATQRDAYTKVVTDVHLCLVTSANWNFTLQTI